MTDRPEKTTKVRSSSWRKWTAPGIIVAVVLGLFVPEIRRALHLEKPAAPPIVSQETKSTTSGSNNVAGNNVTGNGNIVGNDNTINPGDPLLREARIQILPIRDRYGKEPDPSRDPLPVGKAVALDVFFWNDGGVDAERAIGGGLLYILPDNSADTERKTIAEFKKFWAKAKKNPQSLEPGILNQLFFTASGPVLTDDDKAALQSGTKYLYLLLSVDYKDGKGTHFKHMCRYLQPPAFSPYIWQSCEEYNDHK
jgi:hypothetical protein